MGDRDRDRNRDRDRDSFRGPPGDVEKMVSLKVDNLTYRTTVDDLTRIFTKCGKLGDVYIPRSNRGSRGFAFVRFFSKRDAEDAISRLDGTRLDGREIRIQMARYARPDSGRRRGSGYRDRSRSRSRSRDRDDRRRRRSSSRSSHGSDKRRRSRDRSPRENDRSEKERSPEARRSAERSNSREGENHD